MWPPFIYLLLILLVGVSGAFIYVYRAQERKIETLRKAREKIQIEEDRVFEFLLGLNEAFSDDIRSSDLHRLIVEGATRILNAHGGAVYLANDDQSVLLPSFISKGCPPLVEVPPHILQQTESTPQALESYLRLHAINRGEGLIGTVWNTGEALLLADKDSRLTPLRDMALQTDSAMICPLTYGRQTMGVLAVANGPMSDLFSPGDFGVFNAIAQISAFTLYNAIVYSQANEKKRLDRDLQTAQDIQKILLPSSSPALAGFEISGVNIPAMQVSGDYFDYIRVDEHRLGVAIADVSGKGVPASLIMAMCRSVLRGNAPGNLSAAEVLNRVNRQLYPDIKEDMFISMAYMILDGRTNQATLCRAGHDAPILFRGADHSVEKLNPPGMALGIDRGDVFERITENYSVSLESGDCLVLYTDGVTEALDRRGFEFGMNRMMQAIQLSAANGAQAVIDRLKGDLDEFVGKNPQTDDITLIVVRRQ